ncbi:MAG: hypothetical protein ABJE66_31880 [Deltaproteobacteria bacterium]
MKHFLIITIVSALLSACGAKKQEATTPTNKTGTTDATKGGSMGGTTYGGGSAKPTAPTTGGDPCAM